MFGFQMTDYDKKVFAEQLADFLPDQIIDCHVHIDRPGSDCEDAAQRKGCVSWPGKVAKDCTIEDLMASYEAMFPGKTVRPVLMTSPTHRLETENPYALACGKKYGLPVMYCVTYKTTKEEIWQAFADGFCGIKPYQNHSAPYIPANEVRIFDFLTPEHLEAVNELGGVVMLHISRPKRLRDEVNLAQMLEIEEKYPRVKLIIAHIGRAYSPEDIGDAFEVLRDTKNMVFDFTANTLDLAMEKVLTYFGSKRLLFGSDMPITKMRMYRVSENGVYYNVVPRGLYGDVSDDVHMRETDDASHITTFMNEELLAFKRAALRVGLSREEVFDVMCGNAARIFNMEVKK